MDETASRVLILVIQEMNRTRQNLDNPSEADYMADIVRFFSPEPLTSLPPR